MMNNDKLMLNANPIVEALQKPAAEFTKADIIDTISAWLTLCIQAAMAD